MLAPLGRHLARFAIHRLPVAFVAAWAISFILLQTSSDGEALYAQMILDPAAIRAGEWWRAISFLLMPPSQNMLFLFIECYVFLLLGNTLEARWGAGRFNLYVLIYWAATLIAAFTAAAIDPTFDPSMTLSATLGLTTCCLLAFAALIPDMTFLAFFVIPVKVRYLALIIWLYIAYVTIYAPNTTARLLVLASVVNYGVFFATRLLHRGQRSARSVAAKVVEVREAKTPFHRCARCGVSDLDDPGREFRVVSDDNGSHDVCRPCLDDGTAINTRA
ncbi:MAG: hypothetical protein ACYTF0_05555 [Planctomycetota bacterium]|jgi:hypothetical protein